MARRGNARRSPTRRANRGGQSTSGLLALAVVVAFFLAGYVEDAQWPTDRWSPNPSPTVSAPPGGALEQAKALTVKGRAPKTGYARSEFGPTWKDTDGNGCDTRNDILARDLVKVKYNDAPKNCVVASGVLNDPYTGKKINFTRGQSTSGAVQIDHVVALSDAWQKGAQGWGKSKREKFANDPLNLLAVDGPTNARKGDSDAATWLPPNKAYRCQYVTRQVQVKTKYSLWVTKAEQDAIIKELSKC